MRSGICGFSFALLLMIFTDVQPKHFLQLDTCGVTDVWGLWENTTACLPNICSYSQRSLSGLRELWGHISGRINTSSAQWCECHKGTLRLTTGMRVIPSDPRDKRGQYHHVHNHRSCSPMGIITCSLHKAADLERKTDQLLRSVCPTQSFD